MNALTEIEALALATRAVSDRAHFVGIIEGALHIIRTKDRTLDEVVRRLSPEDRVMIERKVEEHDTRLVNAIERFGVNPAPVTEAHPDDSQLITQER